MQWYIIKIMIESEEKRLMLKSIENLISDVNIFSKLPENKRLAIVKIYFYIGNNLR